MNEEYCFLQKSPFLYGLMNRIIIGPLKVTLLGKALSLSLYFGSAPRSLVTSCQSLVSSAEHLTQVASRWQQTVI